MSRSQNLRHNVINQATDDMVCSYVPSPLLSQSVLAEMYNINRITVRHMLSHLGKCGVLTQVGSHYVIMRRPDHDDGSACTTTSMTEQNRTFEQAFFTMASQWQLHAGESFSELQLTRAVGISSVVVQGYFLKFERYNLAKNEKRGQRSMKQFDQAYAEQLFELREMLETHFLQYFLNLPDDDPRWLQIKTLLECHRILCDSIGSNFRTFSRLDRESHASLLSAADNVFFNQSFEIISVIFYFHCQWDESGLKQRNIIAIDEHMTTLNALICRSDLDVIFVLCNHSNSAKQSIIRSINRGCNAAH